MISFAKRFGTIAPNLFWYSIMERTYSTIVFFFIFGCGSNFDHNTPMFNSSEEVFLKENLTPIASIKSFDILIDSTLVIITDANQVIRYSSSGEQIEVLENFGQGSLELYSPSLIRAYNDGFIIWDESLLKMVEFDKYNRPIFEYLGFNHAIRKFTVDENYFYTYINPHPNQPFVQVFDKKRQALVKELGIAENMDIINNLNRCAGGLTFSGDNLLFVSSSTLRIFNVDRNTLSKFKVILLEDNNIKFIDFGEDAVSLINTNISKAFQVTMSNSIVTGVYHIGSKTLLTGETGESVLSEMNVDLSKRKTFFLLLDNNFNIIGRSIQNFDVNSLCSLWSDSGGKLYRIFKKEGKDEYSYYLEKFDLILQ